MPSPEIAAVLIGGACGFGGAIGGATILALKDAGLIKREGSKITFIDESPTAKKPEITIDINPVNMFKERQKRNKS